MTQTETKARCMAITAPCGICQAVNTLGYVTKAEFKRYWAKATAFKFTCAKCVV